MTILFITNVQQLDSVLFGLSIPLLLLYFIILLYCLKNHMVDTFKPFTQYILFTFVSYYSLCVALIRWQLMDIIASIGGIAVQSIYIWYFRRKLRELGN